MNINDRNNELREAMERKKEHTRHYEANPSKFIVNFIIAFLGTLVVEAFLLFIFSQISGNELYPKGIGWVIAPIFIALTYARQK
nr:hypothetical protein [uncultured Sulfurimonas sp.]